MKIELNKELFYVNEEDFQVYKDSNYTTLKLYPQLGILEREIGLITDIINNFNDCEFINIGISHGGYVPIRVLPYINEIYVVEKDVRQIDNLMKNCEMYDPESKIKLNNIRLFVENKLQIIKLNTNNLLNFDPKEFNDNSIIITYNELSLLNYKKYNLTNSNLILYVSNKYIEQFENNFKYYITFNDNINILDYNNLINLCMIVKNAGEGFKEILEKNLPYIDRWTILDTGSTDSTVQTIQEVLKHKQGTLYQEPFINFRESRNRCLELAGTTCKYTIMLDDTYVLKGNVREFLEYIRSDQFADSYNVFIQSLDNIYGSNRILKSDRKLKYIYRIHEIIQNDNNIVVQLPLNKIWIDDITSEYMTLRTHARKESDLKLLLETLEEYPNVPRTLYYITQTYSELKMWGKAFEYGIKRIQHPIEGYKEEVTECYLICANIAELEFKWDWQRCEELYLQCYNHDPLRADALYCLGVHYLNLEPRKAFDYLKKGFELGVPQHATSNLRYNIYNKMLPYHLSQLCYKLKEYKLGEQVALKYLKENKDETIMSYYKIFQLFNLSIENNKPKKVNMKDILCFVAFSSFKDWNGDSINIEGVGGSETFIIEMAKHIAKLSNFEVYVFCNTDKELVYDNVKYNNIRKYIKFINTYQVHTSIISRYSEYIPVTLENNVENVYFIAHDTIPSGNVIPLHPNLKGVFCMTEWHKQYFTKIFPSLNSKIFVFPNGININQYPINIQKKKNSFCYSSFPNRGLINLLKMFPTIRQKLPGSTLNVFCDTKHKWTRSVANEEMDEIEKLLEEQKEYVTNHGWVKKDVLTKYFLESEIWLYPCTFQETFCITALEAAASSTLAITNNLAALNDTVGDRGIIIPGNPRTTEWQDNAINELINILNDVERKQELLNKNRKWAENHDWIILTQKIMNDYIGVGKPSNTIFTKYYTPIEENIKYLCSRFSHCKKVLEIGAGDVPFPLATHFVDHIKNDQLSNLTVMDITQEKLPFKDNEFDLVYCRHVLEDIHNPEFVIKELCRVAKILYIETPSPLVETSRHIDGASPYYRGYIHHRYMIWVHNNQIKLLPKYPVIEYIKLQDYHKKLQNPWYWNTYYIWNKNKDSNTIVNYLKYDIDYQLHTEYEKMVNTAIDESTKSIKLYKNQIKLTKNSLNHCEMLNWSHDIPKNSKQLFETVLNRFKNKNINILEIGTYAGTSIISMLKYLPDANATVIDMWEDYDEAKLLRSIKDNKIEQTFLNNITISNMIDRVTVMKGDSKDVLMKLLLNGNKYDFIYVDGSHKCLDCYSDMIVGWQLLNNGGVMGIDDYLWAPPNNNDNLNLPYYAVKHFMERYKGTYTLLNMDYRVFLLKN